MADKSRSWAETVSHGGGDDLVVDVTSSVDVERECFWASGTQDEIFRYVSKDRCMAEGRGQSMEMRWDR